MNAYEIAERFDISLPKAKKMAKAMSLPAPKGMPVYGQSGFTFPEAANYRLGNCRSC